MIRLSRAQQEIANQRTKHIYQIMDKLHLDRTDYSVVVKNRAPPSELVEVGDLSRWEIKPYRAVIGVFSHHGDGQSGAMLGIGAVDNPIRRFGGFRWTRSTRRSKPRCTTPSTTC